VIKKGGTVAFPTETVYGLGADALNEKAVLKIFKAKNRPADNPLIVHVCSIKQAEAISFFTPESRKLAKKFWPGPLTMLLYKKDIVPYSTTAGSDKVAVRMPSNKIALALIRKSNTPIAAPSANTSTKPSPTSAAHVKEDINNKIDIIIDGGTTKFGLESTIINMTSKVPTILRPGPYSIEDLNKTAKIIFPRTKNIPIVPGMKYRHYAPKTKMVAVGKAVIAKKAKEISKNTKVCVICSDEISKKIPANIKIIKLGSESSMNDIAKNLFSSFRKLDSENVDICLIQKFKNKGLGRAVMNRISKASSSNQNK
jgi:L-threonylcarbamoyladenylate synthase